MIGLDKGAVSRSVASLVAGGHVAEGRDPGDARRQRLSLTVSGHELHNRIFALAMARQELMLADFTPEERAVLLSFLRRLQARLPRLRDPAAG